MYIGFSLQLLEDLPWRPGWLALAHRHMHVLEYLNCTLAASLLHQSTRRYRDHVVSEFLGFCICTAAPGERKRAPDQAWRISRGSMWVFVGGDSDGTCCARRPGDGMVRALGISPPAGRPPVGRPRIAPAGMGR